MGDGTNRRVTLFDRQGAVLRTIRAPEHVFEPDAEWIIRIMGTTYLGNGRLRGDRLAVAVRRDMPDTAITIPRLIFDTTGAIIDTAGMRRISMAGARNPVTVSGRELFLPRIAVDTLDVEADGGSLVISRTVATSDGEGTFGVVRLAAGDTIFAREYRYRPEPTPSWVVDSMASRFARTPSRAT